MLSSHYMPAPCGSGRNRATAAGVLVPVVVIEGCRLELDSMVGKTWDDRRPLDAFLAGALN